MTEFMPLISRRRIAGWLAGLPMVAGASRALFADVPLAELDDAEFRRLHAELQPPPDAPWRTIPWKIALLDAQQEAAKSGKPIFIWAMDGHPLGCT